MNKTELTKLRNAYEHAVRNNCPDHAKPIFAEMLKQAARLGKEAFDRDAKAVPALDPDFCVLLTGNDCLPLLEAWTGAWHKANLAAPVFMTGQCAVYTDGTGTTRSVTIARVSENAILIRWRHKRDFTAQIPLSHAVARKCLVLFPPGEKFMVLEGGAK